jgi:hypothetical protein
MKSLMTVNGEGKEKEESQSETKVPSNYEGSTKGVNDDKD